MDRTRHTTVGEVAGCREPRKVTADLRWRQPGGDGDGDDFVTVRSGGWCGELADTLRRLLRLVRPTKSLRPMRRMSPPSSVPGSVTYSEFAKFGKGLGERRGFWTTRIGAERKNYGQFIKDNGGIFNEHGIREIGLGGEGNNAGAEFCE